MSDIGPILIYCIGSIPNFEVLIILFITIQHIICYICPHKNYTRTLLEDLEKHLSFCEALLREHTVLLKGLMLSIVLSMRHCFLLKVIF